jgi:hypothetical protein
MRSKAAKPSASPSWMMTFWASVRDGFRQIDEYWFGYGSPVTLGLMRIFIGIAVFLNLLITFAGFDDWYTEHGYVPQSAVEHYSGYLPRDYWFFGPHTLPFTFPRLNLLSMVTDSRITFAFWVITLIACLTMTLGLWSRLSAIVLAIGIISIHHRNAIILHGGDTLQRIAVMYMALAPCGKACSLDRLIGLGRQKIKPGPVLVSMWPQRLITFNLALVYFTTVWHKWGGSLWRNGTATWFPARLNEFKRFWVPDFVNQLPMVKFTTYGTLATELAMATLVFYKPLRKWVLLAGLLMHGYIEYSMNIPLFSLTICSLYITFYEGEEVTAWALRMGQRLKRLSLRVLLPEQSQLKPSAAALLSAVDPFDLVAYETGSAPAWEAVDANGAKRNPFKASRLRSVGAWVTYPVPGLWRRMLERSIEPALDEIETSPRRVNVKARR